MIWLLPVAVIGVALIGAALLVLGVRLEDEMDDPVVEEEQLR